VPPIVVSSVLAAVQRAQLELQARVDSEKPVKPETATSDTGWRAMTLAVWDRTTDVVEYVTGQKKGSQLKLTGGYSGISVSWSAGVYSEYRSSDPNKVVVAVRYPLYIEKAKKRFEIREVVYTPSSEGLRIPDVVEEGQRIMESMVADAYADLDRRNVRSRAVEGRLVSEVIEANAAKAVIMIEHMDDLDLIRQPTSSVNKVYTAFAVNQERAYAYTQSHAGARGLVQFMPTSYRRFAAIRPEVGLEPDFERAMDDGRNAIKAEIAYLDYLLAAMPDQALADFDKEKERIHEFAVASYNAGPARVIKALPHWDRMWSGQEELRQQKLAVLESQIEPLRKRIFAEDDESVWKPLQKKLNALRAEVSALKSKTTSPPLKRETLEYLKKYRAVLPYLPSQSASLTVS
jgi:hypothetical protein